MDRKVTKMNYQMLNLIVKNNIRETFFKMTLKGKIFFEPIIKKLVFS